MRSRPCWLLFLCLASLSAGACAVRSISDSGYREGGGSSPIYRGELHDLDLLGRDEGVAQNVVRFDVKLNRNAKLLVVQSGAMMPDDEMLSKLGAHFQVGTLSGIPRDSSSGDSYRHAAQRGGYDAILCYWGVLETAQAATAGKGLVWVPIVGFFVPDESQYMRIRLKLLVLDVGSGAWTMLMPTTADDERASSLVTRASSDQEQVQKLKSQA